MSEETNIAWSLNLRQRWVGLVICTLSFLLVLELGAVLVGLAVVLAESDFDDLGKELRSTIRVILFFSFLVAPFALFQAMGLIVVIPGTPMRLWSFALRGALVTAVISGVIAIASLLFYPESWSVFGWALIVLAGALAGAGSGWALGQYLFWLKRRGRLQILESEPVETAT